MGAATMAVTLPPADSLVHGTPPCRVVTPSCPDASARSQVEAPGDGTWPREALKSGDGRLSLAPEGRMRTSNAYAFGDAISVSDRGDYAQTL
jgi:hypothetical protein